MPRATKQATAKMRINVVEMVSCLTEEPELLRTINEIFFRIVLISCTKTLNRNDCPNFQQGYETGRPLCRRQPAHRFLQTDPDFVSPLTGSVKRLKFRLLIIFAIRRSFRPRTFRPRAADGVNAKKNRRPGGTTGRLLSATWQSWPYGFRPMALRRRLSGTLPFRTHLIELILR
jgi:hypothetical protein